jgi:hypothetical protein
MSELIIQFNASGIEYARYSNVAQAGKATGFDPKDISQALDNKSLMDDRFYWVYDSAETLPKFMKMHEFVAEWKKHPVYDYYISPKGDMWNLKFRTFKLPEYKNRDFTNYITYMISYKRTPKLCRAENLVAETYIRPLAADEMVIHRDGNTLNNSFDNLQIVKSITVPHKTGRIIQLDRNGKQMAIYDNIVTAVEKSGVTRSNMSSALSRKICANGFKWEYEYTQPNAQIDNTVQAKEPEHVNDEPKILTIAKPLVKKL